ncbi:MAG: DUF4125 family protein [Peptococcaceae bacterium]|jgi:hypothetical protein|nr:DUF4125 family protein [Peptococcaceae bacterium]
MIKATLIDKIVAHEWRMFQQVENIGGRAACQDNPETFKIMRSSQAASWPENVLASYLDDLKTAAQEGDNLLTEKYARMMASTSPREYAEIEHLLTRIEPEKSALADQIAEIHLAWERELAGRYPYVSQRGRPLFSREDSLGATSVETYLRGELLSFSMRTLELYYQETVRQQAAGINGSEAILLNTVKQYGFSSLEEANEQLRQLSLEK